MFVLIALRWLPLFSLCIAPKRARRSDTQPVDIGVNVGGVNDFAVESFFVDAMKQSRHWGSAGNARGTKRPNVDAQGWPTQDAGAVILCCVADAVPATAFSPARISSSFKGIANVAFTVSRQRFRHPAWRMTPPPTRAPRRWWWPPNGAGTSVILSFTGTQRSAAAPLPAAASPVSR